MAKKRRSKRRRNLQMTRVMRKILNSNRRQRLQAPRHSLDRIRPSLMTWTPQRMQFRTPQLLKLRLLIRKRRPISQLRQVTSPSLRRPRMLPLLPQATPQKKKRKQRSNRMVRPNLQKRRRQLLRLMGLKRKATWRLRWRLTRRRRTQLWRTRLRTQMTNNQASTCFSNVFSSSLVSLPRIAN